MAKAKVWPGLFTTLTRPEQLLSGLAVGHRKGCELRDPGEGRDDVPRRAVGWTRSPQLPLNLRHPKYHVVENLMSLIEKGVLGPELICRYWMQAGSLSSGPM